MRRILVAAGGALVLMLAGCSNEAGPKPGRPAPDPGPEALQVKLDALAVDPCFVAPEKQKPKGCEKYVTQLANTALTARKLAGTRNPGLAAQADQLDKAVATYRDKGCNAAEDPGTAPCGPALTDMSAALRAIKASLRQSQATTG
ncbi:hypothetical protein [Amycolatopsis anabasis]|uniref:hypothetical protein n=1 Tax=Amycolatopsis anabasis TaxID=1840409 RepID=UPI001FEB55EC|nr:hypothetical protein [Amycolatopsis anabasis]